MNVLSYNVGSVNMNGVSSKNKIDALRSFIFLMELDIVMLQEVTEQIDINGFEAHSNIDHTKRGTEILIKSHIKTSRIQRSIDSRILSIQIDDQVTICNVYAPSGSAQKAARERFFTDTIQYYINQGLGKLIIGGDFNAVINRKDANHTSNHSQSLKFLVQSLNLSDAWEIIHKTVVDYTFIRNGSGARLDRFYVSEELKKDVVDVKSNSCCFSDHKAIIMKVKLQNLGKPFGKSLWRLNESVLTEENIAEFRVKWNWLIRQKRHYDSWFSWWTEFAKKKVVSFFKWKTSIFKRRYHDTMEFFYSALNLLNKDYVNNPNLLSEINHVKGKMLALQKEISKSFYAHSKTMINGEDTTIFHIGEQIKQKRKTEVKSLEIGGNIETNREKLHDEMFKFYQDLYSRSEVLTNNNFDPEKSVDENLPANRDLMNAVTEDELFHSIKTSQSKKSPGVDGLTKCFYLKCWNIIKTELVYVVNDVLNGKMCKEFIEGVIILIRKKGNSNDIQNYRPITLLNFDYKLVSRILKNRLNNFTSSVMSNSQKCSNSHKNIYEVTCSLRDKILETNLKKKTSLMISFDLEKAFDRVNHSFLEKTLEKMGINAGFIRFIKQIHEHSQSRLLINGTLSSYIKIGRSVRQGDPLSMLLFCLYLEPLLQKLQNCCRTDLDVLFSYADDISLILNDLRKLPEIKQIFDMYEKVAGAKVNFLKTKAMIVGFDRRLDVPGWINLEEKIKILGIWYHNSSKLMVELNWHELLQNLRFMLWNNQFRNLNLIQKVAYLNIYASSKIWYVASTVPIDKKSISKIKCMYGSFLWNRASLRIAFDQLCLPKKSGGLGLISPEHKCKALLLNRYIRLKRISPYFHTFTDNLMNPPNLKQIPLNSLYIKLLFLELPYLPNNLKGNPSSISLYNNFIALQPKPHIMIKYPQYKWEKIWKNVFDKKISSEYQVAWYLLVNEKISCAEQQFRFGRISSQMCVYCPQQVEDIKHKYSSCEKVRNCWWYSLTQIKLINRTRTRNIGFDHFKYPELKFFKRVEKRKAASIFLEYLKYVQGRTREDLDVNELRCNLTYNL